jgi:hypothetical protein
MTCNYVDISNLSPIQKELNSMLSVLCSNFTAIDSCHEYN